MTLTIINQTVLQAPFQTIHNPISCTRYLSKLSTFPIHMVGTDDNLIRTPGTFLNHQRSHFVHEVPFQAIHIPNPYTVYQRQPILYSEHLSKPSTFPFRTRGTFSSCPHSQSIRRVPCQTTIGQLTSRRMEDHNLTHDNSTSSKMKNLNKVSSYIKRNDSTITKTTGLSKTILRRHKSSI
jgi:hypothetical protein